MLKFDRANSKALSAEVIAALQTVAERHGLTVKPVGGTIGDIKVMLKMEFTVADKAAAGVAERDEFALYCHMFGLKPEHYKVRFSARGETYELFGFKPRRPKFGYHARRVVDGKTILFTSDILPKIRSKVDA